jgi:hypothetical protein
METADTRKAARVSRTPDLARDKAAATSEHPFGPHAAQILATEHWSLLASRSLIWNEAMSRTTVFLTVLSAAIIALALLADATGFGPQTPPWPWCCCRSCCCSASPPTCAWSRSTPGSSSWCWP